MTYQKPTSIIPRTDKARLSKLYEYHILDTPPEETFDSIAKLAAQIFDTPSAFVSFVDEERVFFKANMSTLEGNEVLRKDSLCSLAILENHITVFNDTHQIPDLMESPHVCGEGGIRFYAGAPLRTPEGHRLGTICVVDAVPREASEKQLKMLETLSIILIEELENRMRSRKALKTQVDLMNIAIHELKNPASNIQLAVNMLRELEQQASAKRMLNTISKAVKNITAKLSGLLALSQMEDSSFELKMEKVDVAELLNYTKKSFELLARQKGQHIITDYDKHLPVILDRTRITDVFQNLLSNAIKFSYPDTEIMIAAKISTNAIIVEFRDQGQGLSSADKEKLFVKFAKLSAIPTGKERSTGLGLSICKTLVDMHKGKIWAASEGAGRGTSFFVSLPADSVG